jgi:shikimate kinase
MGVGKTTVGKLLAEKLCYGFIDMDAMIEKNEGVSISDIFRLHGEPRFRQIEAELVKKLSKQDGLVIACGGGAVADPVNAEMLRSSSRMVYLTASMDEIVKRTSVDNSRPLLNVESPAEEASRLYEARKPIYTRYADVSVDTTRKTPGEVVAAILEEL